MRNILNKKNLFIFLIGLFAVTSVFYTIETVTESAEVAALEKTNNNLLLQERDLTDNYVKTLSLNAIQEKGTELGFIKPSNIVYVSQNEPVTASR